MASCATRPAIPPPNTAPRPSKWSRCAAPPATGCASFSKGPIPGEAAVQVYALDSQDGLVGRDFHPGSATQCAPADITSAGACPITLAVGAAAHGNAGIDSARQAKVVFRALDDWRWDGAIGTPMIVTLHLTTAARAACGTPFFNAGYAVWSGTDWDLLYDASGDCPRSWPGVQAPMPFHLGGTRYALYFNLNGPVPPARASPPIKPMNVLYGDARLSGDPTVLEFDDWERITAARGLDVYWPDGTPLSEAEENQFDDHVVFAPTARADERVISSNMACTTQGCVPFIGGAVLLNP